MKTPGGTRALTSGVAALTLSATTLTLSAPSLAAQEPDPRVQERDSVVAIPLAPLTVTVLRTPFDVSEAPFAVAAVGAAQARRARPGFALDEALRGVPGVQVDNRYNYALGERISIRGFGARAQFGVRGVKVLVDGIPATLPDGQTTLNHVDLASLGRVEVMRGPASALYGNAAGGVIRLETAPPPAVPVRQEIRVLGGQHGLRRLESTTSGRSGRASYLISLNQHVFDGYREFGAAENLHANARFGYRTDAGQLRVVANVVDYDAKNPGSLSTAQLAEDRDQANPSNVERGTSEQGRQAQLGLTWSGALAAGELELSAYGITREVSNPIPPAIIDLDRAAGGVRALYGGEAPLGGRAVRWAIGAEAELQRDDRLNHVNEQGERGALTLDQFETVSTLGSFAQLSARLAGPVGLVAGLRYDRFRFEVDDRLVSATNPDDSGSRTMDALSPSLGLSVEVAPDRHVYGNVASSFETPTTTELANRPDGAGGFNPGLEPQRARSFEVGTKGRLGHVVGYQFAAYRVDLESSLISFEVPDAPGRAFFRNAGSAVHRGVETGVSLALGRRALAQLAYTYTDARFHEYATADAVHDGNEVPGIAPHRLEGILSYRAPADWYVDLESRYVSGMAVDDANTAASPAHAVTDVRAGLVGLRLAGATAAPFLGVTNLFDREYNASVVINAFGARYYEPGPGRAFYAGLSVSFGSE